MDFSLWRQHLIDGLGHDAAIPWHEPIRLDVSKREAIGRLALKSASLMSIAAAWEERLAQTATEPDEVAALLLLGEAYRGHAMSLRRLARQLLGERVVWFLPDQLPILPLVGRLDLLLALHAAGVISRVWIQAVLDVIQDDPVSSSVFASMLYERSFIVSYAKSQLVRAGDEHALQRRRLRLVNGALVPAMVAGSWLLMGQDFRAITGWDWQMCIGRCHQVYEQAYTGELSFLQQRGTLTALAWVPL